MNMMVSAAAMASATTALTSAPIEKPSADAALLEMEERIFQHREAAEAIEPELDRLRAIWKGELRRRREPRQGVSGEFTDRVTPPAGRHHAARSARQVISSRSGAIDVTMPRS
jgi:hypothetical protein